MSPTGKRLWKILPIGTWVEREQLKKQFGEHGFQSAINDLLSYGLVDLEFRDRDEYNLYADKKQFIRRKPIAEIQEYWNQVVNPKSEHYNKVFFHRMMVKCSIKPIKYENPLFRESFAAWRDGRKKKSNQHRIMEDDGDW